MFDHPAHALIWLLLRHLGGKSSIASRPSPEQGLTIMECLVAVLLIALTIAMIAPPLVLATATRVQNRRAEQAMRVAQGEIDRLRTAVAMGLHTPANLPAIAPGAMAATLANVAAPTAIDTRLRSLNPTGANCPTTRFDPNSSPPPTAVAATSTLPVDVDGDCVAEYLVQVFRTAGLTSTAQQAPGQPRLPSEFDVGVRVYPIQAASNYTPQAALNTLTLPSTLGRTPAPLQLTAGNQRGRPLAVLYSKFVWAEDRTSLCSYFSQGARQQIVSCAGSFPAGTP
ncbi:type II secretion system protein [Leptolyngbya ohadii]|uniref:type II secretion system protein n=1 Tax=Leptolyngbya ohadii TaxID=1962290 RepID=UPI00117A347B|nr:type II secretion system protein [Leptolyngbya ohadii]